MSDPMFESSLDRQIRAYADGGLRPFERYAIAQGLVAGSRRRGLWWLPGIGRPLLSRSYVLVVVGLMLALLAIAVAGAYLRRDDAPAPPLPGRNGLIAYQVADMDRAPWNHVHVMIADGTNDREVIAGVDPTYSRDGSVLVFVGESSTPGSRLLTIADPDGATERLVSDLPFDQFGISPDGSRLALVEPDRGLWLLSLTDYPRHRPLVPYTQSGYQQYLFPEWSPDGSHVAYAVIRNLETATDRWGFREAIGVVNVATGERRLLTARPGDVSSGMSWSPDGTYLAYTGLPDGAPSPLESSINASVAQDVFTVRLSDAFESNLTQSTEAESTLEWAPDGTAIGVLAIDGSAFEISVVPVTGGQQTGEKVSTRSFTYASNMVSSRIEESFVWSPDARSLLIASYHETAEPGGGFRPEYSLAEFDRSFSAGPKVLVTSRSPIGAPTWQWLEP